MTRSQRRISLSIKRENSGGVLPAGARPKRVSVALASPPASTWRNAVLSVATTSGGVPAGATSPLQKFT